jgi:hypothetical protein
MTWQFVRWGAGRGAVTGNAEVVQFPTEREGPDDFALREVKEEAALRAARIQGAVNPTPLRVGTAEPTALIV